MPFKESKGMFNEDYEILPILSEASEVFPCHCTDPYDSKYNERVLKNYKM